MNTLQIKNLMIGEGSPKIIVPLVSTTKEELLEEAQVVKELKPDVVEWRVDLYRDVENLESVKEMISALRTVFTEELILFTFRSHKEGGSKVITDDFYVQLNQTAIRTGKIELVDVELFNEEENVKAILGCAKEHGVYVIMSNHDFEKTPAKEEIVSRLKKNARIWGRYPKNSRYAKVG